MISYLRYIKRAVVFFVLFVLLLTVQKLPVSAEEEDEGKDMQLYAQSAVLMDAGSGRILFKKNGRQVRPMASTTKIMTCILALEKGNPDDYVTVSAKAASMPKVKLSMLPGERYRLKDLLYSLMLESHNDSAVAIAEHIGGSVEGFADMMNEKAQELGCRDTYFVTPNGLDGTVTEESGKVKIHSTTACDLAGIMAYCITESPRREEFLTITRTESYSFPAYQETDGVITENGRVFSCQNHNAFLHMMEGALSGKTGFTGNAGYCYVGSLRQGDRTFVAALLACGWPSHKEYKWSDTKKLMQYGLSHYEIHFPKEEGAVEELPQLPVKNGAGRWIGDICKAELTILSQEPADEKGVLMKEGEVFTVEKKLPDELTAPVMPGNVVGEIRYLLEGEEYLVEYIGTVEEIPAVTVRWCVSQVLQLYMV